MAVVWFNKNIELLKKIIPKQGKRELYLSGYLGEKGINIYLYPNTKIGPCSTYCEIEYRENSQEKNPAIICLKKGLSKIIEKIEDSAYRIYYGEFDGIYYKGNSKIIDQDMIYSFVLKVV